MAPHKICTEFCCSSFLNVQDAKLTKTPDLSNPIHPVFRASNFSSEFDLARMDMSLRLASNLLQAPALVPFINTLSRGVVKNVKGHVKDWRKIDAHDQRALQGGRKLRPLVLHAQLNQDPLSKEAKEHAQHILRELANIVWFELKDFPPGEEGTLAECAGVRGPVPSRSQSVFPRGQRSIIRINRIEYNCLNRRPRVRGLLQSVTYAITLVHELSHALCRATFGQRKPEPFFDKIPFSEIGFVAELFLFS